MKNMQRKTQNGRDGDRAALPFFILCFIGCFAFSSHTLYGFILAAEIGANEDLGAQLDELRNVVGETVDRVVLLLT
jgi:uncharacterized membrane protein YadS